MESVTPIHTSCGHLQTPNRILDILVSSWNAWLTGKLLWDLWWRRTAPFFKLLSSRLRPPFIFGDRRNQTLRLNFGAVAETIVYGVRTEG